MVFAINRTGAMDLRQPINSNIGFGGEHAMINTLGKLAVILATFGIVTGCDKTLHGQISACLEQSSESMSHVLPANEIQKRELEREGQGVFYRCMKDAGFSEKKNFDDTWMKTLKGDYPNASTQENLDRLNEIRSQAMRHDDPSSTLWEK